MLSIDNWPGLFGPIEKREQIVLSRKVKYNVNDYNFYVSWDKCCLLKTENSFGPTMGLIKCYIYYNTGYLHAFLNNNNFFISLSF